jgi:hypothetical protein
LVLSFENRKKSEGAKSGEYEDGDFFFKAAVSCSSHRNFGIVSWRIVMLEQNALGQFAPLSRAIPLRRCLNLFALSEPFMVRLCSR